jgi:hypothetical protein
VAQAVAAAEADEAEAGEFEDDAVAEKALA